MATYKSKKTDPQNRARLSDGKLYLKGKIQSQYVKPILPSPLTPPKSEYNVRSGDKTIKDGGSVFNGYSCEANSLQQVADIRAQLMMENTEIAEATHLRYAFRFEKVTKNWPR